MYFVWMVELSIIKYSQIDRLGYFMNPLGQTHATSQLARKTKSYCHCRDFVIVLNSKKLAQIMNLTMGSS